MSAGAMKRNQAEAGKKKALPAVWAGDFAALPGKKQPSRIGKISVRTVRLVVSDEPDDPSRAAVVDAILERRRRLTAKGSTGL